MMIVQKQPGGDSSPAVGLREKHQKGEKYLKTEGSADGAFGAQQIQKMNGDQSLKKMYKTMQPIKKSGPKFNGGAS